MFGTPAATPVTTPVEPIVARPVLLLLHVPPAVTSFNVVVAPAHNVIVPVIAAGKGLTVTIDVTTAVLQMLVTE